MFERRMENPVECQGTMLSIRQTGGEYPWIASVEYYVDGRRYELTEHLTAEIKKIKLGPIPIGQESRPRIGNVRPGQPVAVCYDPQNPARAYLRDNWGVIAN